MIDIDNVTYSLNGSALIKNVSSVVEVGKLTVILGPNGAGKSTLLKVMSGEYEADDGVVLIENIKLSEWDHQQLATRRAVVSQFNQIEFPFTVAEVVMLGMMPSKKLFDCDDAEIYAEDIMKELDILRLMDRQYSTLSGGEQQRVAIARALVQVALQAKSDKQCYLLFDEPTASLDIQYQHELLKVLKMHAAKNFSIVLILHDMNLALQYADNVIFMKHGEVKYSGSVSKVITEDVIEEIFSIRGVLEEVNGHSKRFYVVH